MTREEAKHMSEVLKAYSEGKTVEYRMTGTLSWTSAEDYSFNDPNVYHYRVKPELKLRPYANSEEFLKAMKEHGPFIQYKYKDQVWESDCCDFYVIKHVTSTSVELNTFDPIKFDSLLNNSQYDFRWQDGTLCGVIAE